jgi:ubiquinone/menaquinone biosynthesis C-methylase UbiE
MSQERIEDSKNTPWWGEHEQRYIEALPYIRSDMQVLDIACGNGFGTYKLFKKGAHKVIGGDISDEALNYCVNKYKKDLSSEVFQFRKLDATNLEFEDATFDIITSFETIEHIKDYKKVVSEFHRVLKKGGVLLLSTPNIIISSPSGVIVNPYHIQEFSYSELHDLLSAAFPECKIGGQKYIRYHKIKSFIAPHIEKFLYLRGVRKLPLPVKNRVLQAMGAPQFYPVSSDYEITYEKERALKCLTLFALCRK